MNFGYLIIVSHSPNADYHTMAEVLALSIKRTQKKGYDNVAIVTDDKNQFHRLENNWIYDRVIFWDKEKHWDGRSWMDQLTPFDNTICLDADMIFTRDYSQWVDYACSCHDLLIAHGAFTYKNTRITSDFYRKIFTTNNLPDVYSAYTFWKSNNSVVKEFFSLARYILKNPNEFSNLFLDKKHNFVLGTDEAFSLSAKLLGIENEIISKTSFPRIVHMKPRLQQCEELGEKWSNRLSFNIDEDLNVRIDNFLQENILHYVEKDIVNRDTVDKYISVMKKGFKSVS